MPTFPQPTSIWHDDTYAAISPTRSELSLAGKTVVVTGGGIGIGGEIAHSVAAAGCTKLILLGRREDALQANKARILSEFDGADVMTISVDVSDRELVNEAFRTAAAHFGKLDVLINNAAYYSGLTSINDSTLESWYPSFEINVKGAFLVTKGFLAYSVPKATVLHISSGIAHINPPWAGYSAYAASKAAATRFFEYLQSEMPDFQVISIHPGTVRTEMSARDPYAAPSDNIRLPADFTVWCASAEASFLKGKMVWSNWDVPELLARKDEIRNSDDFTMSLQGWPW